MNKKQAATTFSQFRSSGSPLDKETGNSREARLMVSSSVGHSARNAAAKLRPADVLRRRPVLGDGCLWSLIDGLHTVDVRRRNLG
jgi:hypothetical protein